MPRASLNVTVTGGKKWKNITVDADIVDALNERADALETELGFRPSQSQTLRHLLKKG